MADTRDALVAIGASTIRDRIKETLRESGISEAVGFEVTLKNGESFTILSDDNPNMDRSAAEVENVAIKQSARAGARVFVLELVYRQR